MGRRRLEGDVRAGMAEADDEHGPVGELRRIPVLARVDLSDAGIELPGDLRDRRHGESPSGHDHLARPEPAVSRGGDELTAAVAGLHQALHPRGTPDGELEPGRV